MAAGGFQGGGHMMARQNTLIVNNIPDYFTEEELKSMFSMFGTVTAVRIPRHPSAHNTLGYGFVEYSKKTEASKAIENVNGLQLGKKKIVVSFSEPTDEAVKQATKVTVSKLGPKVDEEILKEMFSKFGNIVKVRLLRDSVTNCSRRVGFLFFEKWSDAHRAVTEMNGFMPENAKHKLNVKMEQPSVKTTQWLQWQKGSDSVPAPASHGRGTPQRGPPQSRGAHPYNPARPHSQQSQGRKIQPVITPGPSPACVFLYNIGEYVTEQEIYNLFCQFGGLKKLEIVRDMNTQLCKGYAFLTFDAYGAAESAICAMDGMFYRGRQLQVRFKYN